VSKPDDLSDIIQVRRQGVACPPGNIKPSVIVTRLSETVVRACGFWDVVADDGLGETGIGDYDFIQDVTGPPYPRESPPLQQRLRPSQAIYGFYR
jgi:hypothetical protein